MRGLKELGSPVRARGRLGGCWEWVQRRRPFEADSRSGAGMTEKGGQNDGEMGAGVAGCGGTGCNDGAVHSEIPAASAGMTEGGGCEGEGAEWRGTGRALGVHTASEAVRGRFPLGGGNDGERGAGVTEKGGRV